ncbi:hypothetical protein EYC84_005638 [Monilinia fructicola]|uniref:Uncharacterized protein n=1 Tax=Monilinia fructicola TaxID=38448 RepID=A0A5M9K1V8_MONFR|nr:hypothetical protein EYC84_005638 [Monilinia fructicola]
MDISNSQTRIRNHSLPPINHLQATFDFIHMVELPKCEYGTASKQASKISRLFSFHSIQYNLTHSFAYTLPIPSPSLHILLFKLRDYNFSIVPKFW